MAIPPFEVWPDNHTAARVFMKMGTQWIVGAGGVIGLNYPSLDFVMTRCGIKDEEEKDQVFHDIQTIEGGALEQIQLNKEGR